jgi:hypothetical protein
MDQVTAETGDSSEVEAPSDWEDVIEESEANEASGGDDDLDPEEDIETIKVSITPEMEAQLFREMMVDDAARTSLESRLENEKHIVKATKAEIDAIAQRMTQRCEDGRRGLRAVRGRLVRIFETNSLQWVDPKTGLILHSRAMTGAERQQTLDFDSTIPIVNGQAADADAASEPDLPEDDRDSTTNMVDDPEGLLIAADKETKPALEDPPSKPSRRARKAKS